MLESLIQLLKESPLSLWGPFLILVICGLGLPLPEDIVLVTAGILAQDDGRSWIPVAVLMWFGVLLGDSIMFLLGRRFGGKLLAWQGTHHLFPPAKQAKVKALFDRHGATVLLIARFLPGLRAPIFSTAGAMRVPYLKFAFHDGLAAVLSVPLFVWRGHWLWARFSDDMQRLHATLSKTQWFGLGAIALILACSFLFWRWRRWYRERHAA